MLREHGLVKSADVAFIFFFLEASMKHFGTDREPVVVVSVLEPSNS